MESDYLCQPKLYFSHVTAYEVFGVDYEGFSGIAYLLLSPVVGCSSSSLACLLQLWVFDLSP